MKKSFLFHICLLFISVQIVSSQNAVELNRLGFSHYQKGEYEKAIEYFRQSVKKDSSYAKAHFNLSCTLSLVLKDFENYFLDDTKYKDLRKLFEVKLKDEALKHLKRSIELNSYYRSKALSDTDLEYLREEYAYYRMLDYRLDSLNDVYEILTGVSHWAVEGAGIIDPKLHIEFNKDLTFSFWNLHFDDIPTPLDNYYESIFGQFFITKESGKIAILVVFPEERNGKKRFTFEFVGENGDLMIDGSFWKHRPTYWIFKPGYFYYLEE